MCYTFDKHYAHPTANKLTMLKDYGRALVLATKSITDLCIPVDWEIVFMKFLQIIPLIDTHDCSHRIKLVKFIISKYIKLKKTQSTTLFLVMKGEGYEY